MPISKDRFDELGDDSDEEQPTPGTNAAKILDFLRNHPDKAFTAVTARKPTGFSRGRKRVGYAKQPTDYSSADSRPLYKIINKE